MAAELSAVSQPGPRDVAGLREGFGGKLLRPDDADYEAARQVWNRSIDRFPNLIARCAGVADVIGSVNFARGNGLLVGARGRGDRFPRPPGFAGGPLTHPSPRKGVPVQPDAPPARAPAAAAPGGLLPES